MRQKCINKTSVGRAWMSLRQMTKKDRKDPERSQTMVSTKKLVRIPLILLVSTGKGLQVDAAWICGAWYPLGRPGRSRSRVVSAPPFLALQSRTVGSLSAAAPASIQCSQQAKGDTSHDFQLEDDSHLWNQLQDDHREANPGDGSESPSLHQALQERALNISRGIGIPYRVCTMLGFLNVHEAPTSPYDTTNIVNVLFEGQTITSLSAPFPCNDNSENMWIHHDAGGYSVVTYDGFTWLRPAPE
jgi:hypothetical protein